MSTPLRDRDRVEQPTRAMARLERLRELAALRRKVNEAINAEIDALPPSVSFRAVGNVLGEPAWLISREYQRRHAPPSEAAQ
jgi:hypothetical protein